LIPMISTWDQVDPIFPVRHAVADFMLGTGTTGSILGWRGASMYILKARISFVWKDVFLNNASQISLLAKSCTFSKVFRFHIEYSATFRWYILATLQL
jgi:hypothetical protein